MRVVIAEDSVLLRAGVQSLLADVGIETAAAVDNGDDLLVAIRDHRPDLVIADVRMPPTFTDEGLRAALAARKEIPGLPVLVVSQYVEGSYAVDLIAEGTSGVGYLLKERVADVADFLEAVRRVAGGGSAIDPDVVAQMLSRSRDPLEALTARETEVLAQMAQGLSNTAIAKALVVTQGAVENHISNIFAKLGLEASRDQNRRIRAVLTYLDSTAVHA
ncbi:MULTISPECIES: response regulator transcription factor [Amycolatopsis]|uniref:Response regulator transcription factor n=4 Tax=Amycolatopsis TaxID=1813 RepID=A0A1I5I7F1_9PSEU|nr:MULTISPECIES: response regulator transcription factor [Amycolatopsis]MBB1154148.1 response regulator transcription factor [Amycolatopsis dendrobii]NEC61715.1 response regulator transcription factor [Amycolatopsis rubida]OAP25798.1 Transcriptional regulatory protein DegU [Amycolatopsis sp. M39]UKD51475.1 response regulator transcription factor [Amycolatopsis sp. FU40]SFO56513.1 two component transcriptional regulator, LuxR family [Amycolatopsis rubida]